MIKLNKKIYKKEAIKKALEDFSECCIGKIEEDETYYLICLKSKDNLVDVPLDKEFSNYAFGIMQNGIYNQ
jgi:hypothetical protein